MYSELGDILINSFDQGIDDLDKFFLHSIRIPAPRHSDFRVAIGVLEFDPVGQDQRAIDFPAEDKSFGSGFAASEQGHHSGEQTQSAQQNNRVYRASCKPATWTRLEPARQPHLQPAQGGVGVPVFKTAPLQAHRHGSIEAPGRRERHAHKRAQLRREAHSGLRRIGAGVVHHFAFGVERASGGLQLHVQHSAHMDAASLKHICALDAPSEKLLRTAMQKLDLSARAYDRILKVARTIADLRGANEIGSGDLAEAIQYRSLDRESWAG